MIRETVRRRAFGVERLGRVLSKLQVNLEQGLTFAAATIIGAMMLLTTASVVMRRVFNSPIRGDYEYITLLFVFTVFFGLAYAQSRHQHIRIAVVHDWLSPRQRRYVDIVVLTISLGLFLILTWRSAIQTAWALEKGDTILGAIQVKTWPPRLAVAVGAGLLCLRIFVQLVRRVRTAPGSPDDRGA